MNPRKRNCLKNESRSRDHQAEEQEIEGKKILTGKDQQSSQEGCWEEI